MRPNETATTLFEPALLNLKGYATRIRILGILLLALGILYLLGVFGMASYTKTALANGASPNAALVASVMSKLEAFYIFLGVIAIIAAIGLLAKYTRGRMVTIIVAIPLLLLFPVGTLLAAYALYLLLKRGSAESYALLCASKVRPATI